MHKHLNRTLRTEIFPLKVQALKALHKKNKVVKLSLITFSKASPSLNLFKLGWYIIYDETPDIGPFKTKQEAIRFFIKGYDF